MVLRRNILSLIPSNDRRQADLPHAREERQRSKDQRRDQKLVLVQDIDEGVRLPNGDPIVSPPPIPSECVVILSRANIPSASTSPSHPEPSVLRSLSSPALRSSSSCRPSCPHPW